MINYEYVHGRTTYLVCPFPRRSWTTLRQGSEQPTWLFGASSMIDAEK
jgi:hypothetical protein